MLFCVLIFVVFFTFWLLFASVSQESWNGLSGPSWWWWPSASQADWFSCTSSAKSTSIYGRDSRPTTGSYTCRTGRTRVKSWPWRSRRSWSPTRRTKRCWPTLSRTQTPPSIQRQRTTAWRCSMSDTRSDLSPLQLLVLSQTEPLSSCVFFHPLFKNLTPQDGQFVWGGPYISLSCGFVGLSYLPWVLGLSWVDVAPCVESL